MPENLPDNLRTVCSRRRGPPTRPAERRSRSGNLTVNWQVSMPENLTACHSRRCAPWRARAGRRYAAPARRPPRRPRRAPARHRLGRCRRHVRLGCEGRAESVLPLRRDGAAARGRALAALRSGRRGGDPPARDRGVRQLARRRWRWFTAGIGGPCSCSCGRGDEAHWRSGTPASVTTSRRAGALSSPTGRIRPTGWCAPVRGRRAHPRRGGRGAAARRRAVPRPSAGRARAGGGRTRQGRTAGIDGKVGWPGGGRASGRSAAATRGEDKPHVRVALGAPALPPGGRWIATPADRRGCSHSAKSSGPRLRSLLSPPVRVLSRSDRGGPSRSRRVAGHRLGRLSRESGPDGAGPEPASAPDVGPVSEPAVSVVADPEVGGVCGQPLSGSALDGEPSPATRPSRSSGSRPSKRPGPLEPDRVGGRVRRAEPSCPGGPD